MKRKEKTPLQPIMELIQVADLRIRMEYPNRTAARSEAAKELKAACAALRKQIKDLV